MDASTGTKTVEGGMGAILTQTDKYGKFNAISCASTQVLKLNKKYCPFLLEIAAVVLAM